MIEIDDCDAIDIIDRHMQDQGCVGDSLESIKLMQPHLYDMIALFGLEERYAKEQQGEPHGD